MRPKPELWVSLALLALACALFVPFARGQVVPPPPAPDTAEEATTDADESDDKDPDQGESPSNDWLLDPDQPLLQEPDMTWGLPRPDGSAIDERLFSDRLEGPLVTGPEPSDLLPSDNSAREDQGNLGAAENVQGQGGGLRLRVEEEEEDVDEVRRRQLKPWFLVLGMAFALASATGIYFLLRRIFEDR